MRAREGADEPHQSSSAQSAPTYESVYAANRAIYEASLASQKHARTDSNRAGTAPSKASVPSFTFKATGQSVGQSPINGANASSSPAPASSVPLASEPTRPRRKLIRAGDMVSSPSPGTPASADPNQPQTMREKIAQATRSGSAGSAAGSPVPDVGGPPSGGIGLASNGGAAAPATSNPFVAQPSYTNGTSTPDFEQIIEANTRAFLMKNPGLNPASVKQALRHSKGQFDQSFTSALKIILAQQQQQPGGSPVHPPKSISPVLSSAPAFSPPNSGTLLPQSPSQSTAPSIASQPPMSMRYPGQNAAPQQSPPYPGSAAFQSSQSHLAGAPTIKHSPSPAPSTTPQPQLYPHQVPVPAGTAQSINGQSATALPPMPAPPPMLQAPPPVMPGTHPEIGFSALQILPAPQHAQFMALAPSQQIEYSFQVWQALNPEQRVQFSVQIAAQQRMREAWAKQHGNGANTVMIPPQSGAAARSQNPYVGYATQLPTQQQQMQQQRFPGQNPVFRVGAPQPGQTPTALQHQQTMAFGSLQANQTPTQQAYLQEQHRLLANQLTPEQRQQLFAMPMDQQQQWVLTQLQLRAEHVKRQQQAQARIKQQQMMAQKHQQHKEKKKSSSTAAPAAAPAPAQATSSSKKKRRRNHSDSDDDDLRLNDDSSGDDRDDDDADGVDDSEDEAEREAKAIEWFNNTTLEELMEMTGCKPEQAEAVIEMRPYLNPSDARGKLRKRKGVSGNLFDNYVDLMHSYAQTDDCLEKCRGIGKQLENILSIWTGGKKIDVTESMRPSAEPEDVKAEVKLENGQVKTEEPKRTRLQTIKDEAGVNSASSSRASSPTLSAESAANVGAALVEMSDEVLMQSRKQDASEEVKKAFEGYLYEQPKGLSEGTKLKGYQLLGVNWLKLLYNKGISCILADEMGLGKTIQVIAFISHLKEIGKPGPHLIIVPSSTLDNWIREFEKFAPNLTVYAYYGSQSERQDARFFLKGEKNLDVLVTTYNMATGASDDKKFLRKMDFKACVFDEGHQLKNAESKRYKDLMEIKVGWRLLLTGTPLQNNLQELVSLLSFILPKIFLEAQESLRAIFKVPPDAHKNLLTRQRVRAAKQVMTPFVLRRKKLQVLRDLPPKTEHVEYCEMTQSQREIYRETLEKHKKAVIDYTPSGEATPAEEGKDAGKPPPKKRGRQAAKTGKAVSENSTSNVLMALRKAANHPMLFRKLYDDKKIRQMAKDCLKEEEFADRNVDYIFEDMDLMTDFELHRFVQPYKYLSKYALKKNEWMDAGKVKKLMQMLPEIKARGDRVLIFSQFVSVLEILGLVLETMDLKYLTLTGQTNVNDRQGLVDEFTENPDITCFLLSTRAGGLGLNLMAANVVIIMDMDFNPHNDKQAQDRAFRIGQTKEVTIYKFVTRGTIEEDMLELANTKLALDEQVSAESAVTSDVGEKNLDIDEGQEGVVEKKVKASLMQTLQKRFEGGDADFQHTQTDADANGDSGAKLEEVEGEEDKPVDVKDESQESKPDDIPVDAPSAA